MSLWWGSRKGLIEHRTDPSAGANRSSPVDPKAFHSLANSIHPGTIMHYDGKITDSVCG